MPRRSSHLPSAIIRPIERAGDTDYEVHGAGYAGRRRADPRIAARIRRALGSARSVVNVGAGAGSYEPAGMHVLPIEPSATMRAQRPRELAPAVDAVAESLPLDDDSADAAMAIVTVHQWRDLAAGLSELRRVARGPVVILTFEPDVMADFWLARYAPEMIERERRRIPAIATLRAALGPGTTVETVPVPRDCSDGFTEAYYGRPERLLDPEVRAGQSAWTRAGADVERRFAESLRADLESGAWDRRHGEWRSRPRFEGALRLVVG